MNRTLGNWWISVVLVGVLLNLASAYLKPYTDVVFARTRAWWRGRSQARRDEHAAYVARLRGDPHRQLLATVYAATVRTGSLHSFVAALAFFWIGGRVANVDVAYFVCFSLGVNELISSLRQLHESSITDRRVLEAATPDFKEVVEMHTSENAANSSKSIAAETTTH